MTTEGESGNVEGPEQIHDANQMQVSTHSAALPAPIVLVPIQLAAVSNTNTNINNNIQPNMQTQNDERIAAVINSEQNNLANVNSMHPCSTCNSCKICWIIMGVVTISLGILIFAFLGPNGYFIDYSGAWAVIFVGLMIMGLVAIILTLLIPSDRIGYCCQDTMVTWAHILNSVSCGVMGVFCFFCYVCTTILCFDADSTVLIAKNANICHYGAISYNCGDITNCTCGIDKDYNYSILNGVCDHDHDCDYSNGERNIATVVKLRDVNIGDCVLTIDPRNKEITFEVLILINCVCLCVCFVLFCFVLFYLLFSYFDLSFAYRFYIIKEVLVQFHYTWYDDIFSPLQVKMKKMYLENNHSITLTDDHFVYVHHRHTEKQWQQDQDDSQYQIQKARDVKIGDYLWYYHHEAELKLVKIVQIQTVKAEKRVILTKQPFVLMNNIIASPYAGPHQVYHFIWHFIFKALSKIFSLGRINQLFVSIVSFSLVFGAYAIHYCPAIVCGTMFFQWFVRKITKKCK